MADNIRPSSVIPDPEPESSDPNKFINSVFALPEIKSLLEKISRIAGYIHHKNWAEANAGNLSVNINHILKNWDKSQLISYENYATQWFLVSRSGSRYRDMALEPEAHLVLVSVFQDKHQYYPGDAVPTSEWITHHYLQQQFEQDKVVLHTHPASIIALSHLPEYLSPQILEIELFNLLPELKLYLPSGIAFANYAAPGSRDLMQETARVLNHQKALIWQHHGILCFGKDLDEAFDYMEIVNKAVEIWFLLKK